jgi:hypothetical protein
MSTSQIPGDNPLLEFSTQPYEGMARAEEILEVGIVTAYHWI